MSTFGGLLTGSLGYPPLDNSHQPFKRSSKRPGGPAGRADKVTNKWDCKRKGPYKQVCTTIDPITGKRRKKTVKVRKGWKKKYNKQYRRFVKGMKKNHGERWPKKMNKKRPGYKYKAPTYKRSKR